MSEARKRLLKQYKAKHGKVPSGFQDPDTKATMSAEEAARELSRLVREREAAEAKAASGGESQAQHQAAASSGDYFREVERISRERGLRRTEAQRVILREQPDLWKQMLRRANPHKDDEALFGDGA